MLSSVVAGQLLAGPVGAAWGFAASTVLVIPLFWERMERSVRRRAAAADPAEVVR
jgi:hypothetical protein